MILLVNFKCEDEKVKNKLISDLEEVYGESINLCNYDGINYINISTHNKSLLEKFKNVRKRYINNDKVKDFFIGTTKIWY